MSLDVHLELEGNDIPRGSGIFIRENGATREISREEWDIRFPGREPVVVKEEYMSHDQVFDANITHNLADMAHKAGIYYALWRPDELKIEKARFLIEPLRAGLNKLESDPEYYKQFNASNGWGVYDNLVEFVRLYLKACEQYPEARIRISR